MKIVFIDSSSAILLFKVGLFEKLTKLYKTSVAPAVYEELTKDGYPGADEFKALGPAGRVLESETSRPETRFPMNNSLGKGERETILLCRRESADFIILDDGKAARYCENSGTPFINALLFVRILYFAGQISRGELRHKFDCLIRIGRYSSQIIDLVMNYNPSELDLYFPAPPTSKTDE